MILRFLSCSQFVVSAAVLVGCYFRRAKFGLQSKVGVNFSEIPRKHWRIFKFVRNPSQLCRKVTLSLSYKLRNSSRHRKFCKNSWWSRKVRSFHLNFGVPWNFTDFHLVFHCSPGDLERNRSFHHIHVISKFHIRESNVFPPYFLVAPHVRLALSGTPTTWRTPDLGVYLLHTRSWCVEELLYETLRDQSPLKSLERER